MIVKVLFIAILFISLFTLFYLMIRRYDKKKLDEKLEQLEKEKDKSYKTLENFLKKKEEGYFSYNKISKYLNSVGNPFKLNPVTYLLAKFLISLIFLGIGVLTQNYLVAAILTIVGFFALNIIHSINDKNEMAKIKIELQDVYDTLTIQTAAGVFIGKILSEVYLVVSNKRFKDALMKLSAEINMKKNIDSALDKFSEKFRSSEIEGFVMTCRQSLITGQAQQLLEDNADSLKESNLIAIEAQTDGINTQGDLIQTLMFIGIMAIILFGLGIEVINTWQGLFK